MLRRSMLFFFRTGREFGEAHSVILLRSNITNQACESHQNEQIRPTSGYVNISILLSLHMGDTKRHFSEYIIQAPDVVLVSSRLLHLNDALNAMPCRGQKGPCFSFLLKTLQPQLTLNLELEVKVGLVEVVDTDVTILTTGCVDGAEGRDGDVVERTEVTSDTANLLFEDLVVETGFELSLTGAGCGDIHGGLTTSDDNVVLDGCDGGRVEGGIGDVCLHDLECLGVHEL